MNSWPFSISLAYLLGSIPFGYILVRIFRNQDIRESGSGNIGATNVVRSGAIGLGVATLILDLGKAFAAVAFAQHLAPDSVNLAVAAAVAAILGHMYPVWLRFRGGKGVASLIGLALALDWRTGAGVATVMLVVILLTRYVSLGSILGSFALPFFAAYFLRPRSAFLLFAMVFIALLVIFKHHENIRRLLAGTESRLGSKRVS